MYINPFCENQRCHREVQYVGGLRTIRPIRVGRFIFSLNKEHGGTFKCCLLHNGTNKKAEILFHNNIPVRRINAALTAAAVQKNTISKILSLISKTDNIPYLGIYSLILD